MMPNKSTAPNGQRVPFTTRYIVVATDARRPGWSFVWGGSQHKDEADNMAASFRRQEGTAHLTFTVRTRS